MDNINPDHRKEVKKFFELDMNHRSKLFWIFLCIFLFSYFVIFVKVSIEYSFISGVLALVLLFFLHYMFIKNIYEPRLRKKYEKELVRLSEITKKVQAIDTNKAFLRIFERSQLYPNYSQE